MTKPLTLDVIRTALATRAAAFRRITRFEPAGGRGDYSAPRPRAIVGIIGGIGVEHATSLALSAVV